MITIDRPHRIAAGAARALAAAALLALAAAPASAGHGKPGFSLTTGFDYTTGDYGAAADTDILYVPVTVEYETGPWRAGVTVPYISIKGPGNVVGGTDGAIVTGTGGGTTRRTSEGIGDVVLSATYALPMTDQKLPLIELTGKIKLPTADEDEGLGTGEFDLTGQVDVSKKIGRLTPFGTLGYQFIGEPAGTDLDNIFLFSLGAGYEISERLSAGLIFDYRQAASKAAEDPVELTPYVAWQASERLSLNAYLVLGLSDGSPDHGFGVQFTAIW